jgi:hypothetical protein
MLGSYAFDCESAVRNICCEIGLRNFLLSLHQHLVALHVALAVGYGIVLND